MQVLIGYLSSLKKVAMRQINTIPRLYQVSHFHMEELIPLPTAAGRPCLECPCARSTTETGANSEKGGLTWSGRKATAYRGKDNYNSWLA